MLLPVLDLACPCAVPLVPAARAALGRFYTTHPAAGLVRGQSLHHVQAVGLRPPACLELQLLLTGAEGVLHLVLGNGLPLP